MGPFFLFKHTLAAFSTCPGDFPDRKKPSGKLTAVNKNTAEVYAKTQKIQLQPGFGCSSTSPCSSPKSPLSDDSFSSGTTTGSSSPKVRQLGFKREVSVVLIPTISEYEKAGLKKSVWWGFEEISGFKKEFAGKVKTVMQETPGIALKGAFQIAISREED
jgi:hypothetical protein